MTTEILPTDHALAPTAIVSIDRTKLAKTETVWKDNLASYKERFAELPTMGSVALEQWLSDRMAEARAVDKELEDERQLLVRPLIDDKKDIDESYAQTSRPLKEMVVFLKSLIGKSATLRLEAEKAAQATVATQLASGDDTAVQEALACLPESAKVAGVSTTFKWEVATTEVATMPDFWLQPDLAALAAHCKNYKANDNIPPIAGVTFRRVPDVRATARSKKP